MSDGTGAKVSLRRCVRVVVLAMLVAITLAGCNVDVGDHSCGLVSGPTPPARAGAYIWVCGTSDLIIGSVDGGATWQERSRRPEGDIIAGDLWAIVFGNADHGWAVRRGVAHEQASLLASTDGGRHWTPKASVTSKGLLAVSFPDARHGWAVGYGGTVVATTDGGTTWQARNAGGDHQLRRVSFSDAEHGWALIGHEALLTTGDGGRTWSVVRPAGTQDYLTGLATVDSPATGDQRAVRSTSASTRHAWRAAGYARCVMSPVNSPVDEQ